MKYFLTFLEGLASFISPCILPLVPLYISYFMGAKDEAKSKAFINSLSFVFGFSLIFVLMAIFASSIGGFIAKNSRIIHVIFGVILILLGIIYTGIIKTKISLKSFNFKFDVTKLNIFKSFVFGILFSVSHLPCTGVFLASALLLIAKEDSFSQGLILISLYALGIRNSIYYICNTYRQNEKNIFIYKKAL